MGFFFSLSLFPLVVCSFGEMLKTAGKQHDDDDDDEKKKYTKAWETGEMLRWYKEMGKRSKNSWADCLQYAIYATLK